ncbi:hypothetical protein HK102_000919 [Quaeritorhiza haematococci]|nr:hypothetical protein HK102_000919 [Quaeritorhiza haematococci]
MGNGASRSGGSISGGGNISVKLAVHLCKQLPNLEVFHLDIAANATNVPKNLPTITPEVSTQGKDGTGRNKATRKRKSARFGRLRELKLRCVGSHAKIVLEMFGRAISPCLQTVRTFEVGVFDATINGNLYDIFTMPQLEHFVQLSRDLWELLPVEITSPSSSAQPNVSRSKIKTLVLDCEVDNVVLTLVEQQSSTLEVFRSSYLNMSEPEMARDLLERLTLCRNLTELELDWRVWSEILYEESPTGELIPLKGDSKTFFCWIQDICICCPALRTISLRDVPTGLNTVSRLLEEMFRENENIRDISLSGYRSQFPSTASGSWAAAEDIDADERLLRLTPPPPPPPSKWEIVRLHHLDLIHLQDTFFTYTVGSDAAQHPYLKKLELNNTHLVISDSHLQALVENSPAVENLFILTHAAEVTDAGLQHLSRLKYLKVLRLYGFPRVSGAHNGGDNDGFLSFLKSLPRLRELRLHFKNRTCNPSSSMLRCLPHLTQLVTLNLIQSYLVVLRGLVDRLIGLRKTLRNVSITGMNTNWRVDDVGHLVRSVPGLVELNVCTNESVADVERMKKEVKKIIAGTERRPVPKSFVCYFSGTGTTDLISPEGKNATSRHVQEARERLGLCDPFLSWRIDNDAD